MVDDGYIEGEVDTWVNAIETLYGQEVPGGSLGRDAEHSIAMLMSGYGFQDAPIQVLRMMGHAMEIGYVRAINDVERGQFDDDIRMWRPDLNE